MQYFVKKYIPIQAVKCEQQNRAEILELLKLCSTGWEETEEGFIIHTLEGDQTVKYGSNYWIIKGIKNECYLCADDIFQESYEPYERKNHIITITIDEYDLMKAEIEELKDFKNRMKSALIEPMLHNKVPQHVGEAILSGKIEPKIRMGYVAPLNQDYLSLVYYIPDYMKL